MANQDCNILWNEENGVDFFTVVETGESGTSERGLARMSGIPQKTVNRWLSDLSHKGVPKWLEPLLHIEMCLSHEIKKRGKRIKAINARFASRFLSLVARNLKTAESFDTLDAIGEIGFNSFVQGKTGWLPEHLQSSKSARDTLDLLILKDPKRAELHFDLDWRKAAIRVTGYKWDGMPMASFIRRAIYNSFPFRLIERLLEVNPYGEDGRRRQNYHYQHFCPELDEALLKTHIRDVYNLMCISRSQCHFWQLMSDRFGKGIQLDFLDIE